MEQAAPPADMFSSGGDQTARTARSSAPASTRYTRSFMVARLPRSPWLAAAAVAAMFGTATSA